MPGGDHLGANFHFAQQFLVDLPLQRLPGRLSGFNLASWELPHSRQRSMWPSLHAKHFAVAQNYRTNNSDFTLWGVDHRHSNLTMLSELLDCVSALVALKAA